MDFSIGEFQIPVNPVAGVVANFSVRFSAVTCEALSLCQRQDDPKRLFIRAAKARHTGRPAHNFAPELYDLIGWRATALFIGATGADVEYEAPVGRRVTAPDVAPTEDDEAGLRRVIGETMDLAGL